MGHHHDNENKNSISQSSEEVKCLVVIWTDDHISQILFMSIFPWRDLLAPVARHSISRLFIPVAGSVQFHCKQNTPGFEWNPPLPGDVQVIKLFRSPSQCDYCVHIRPNELSHKGNISKWSRCDTTLNRVKLPTLFLKIFKYNFCLFEVMSVIYVCILLVRYTPLLLIISAEVFC